MTGKQSQAVWVSPNGRMQPVGMKGGPLFDAFHGLQRRGERELNASPVDLARAYTMAVWAYRCIKLRADAVASVPLQLLDRQGAPLEDHALLTLLHDVNPHTMNLGDLLRATEAAYNIWGTAYWLKVRVSYVGARHAVPLHRNNKLSLPVKWLQWLNPQTLEPQADSERGIVAYKQSVGRKVREIDSQAVMVFRNFDPLDDLGGLSPLSVALSEVNADLNAARFVADFFANDARPAGLLTTDQSLVESEMERVRTWWQTLFSGAGNRWKTGIVGGGLNWQTISFAPTDLALTELREEDRRAICAVFGVPPGLAGAWESTTYANAREQKASFYEDTILPQLGYIAEVLNWSLLPHYPDLTARGAKLAFDTDSIAALRESSSDKAQRVISLFNAGLLRRNEARSRLGLVAVAAEQDGFVDALASPTDDVGARRAVPAEDDPPTLAGELKRWERFALRRVKAGKQLRHFKSAVIPPGLQTRIEAGLDNAATVEGVFAVFGEIMDEMVN